jgi:hypothetical protein
MRILWLAMAVIIVVAAIGGSTRLDNPNARIGLYCLAAAGGIFFISLLFV